MPPPPPRTGDTASPRAWASRSPAAVVESESDDEDEAQFYAVEAPTMPRPGADRYGKPRLETLAVAEFSLPLLYPDFPVSNMTIYGFVVDVILAGRP